MDFVCKLYGNTYVVHVTVALVGVATLNLVKINVCMLLHVLRTPVPAGEAGTPFLVFFTVFVRDEFNGLATLKVT